MTPGLAGVKGEAMTGEERLRVMVFATSPVLRAGLLSLLSPEASRLGFEIEAPGPLPTEPEFLPDPGEFDVVALVADETLDEDFLRSLSDSVGGIVLLQEDGRDFQRVSVLLELDLGGWAVLPRDSSPAEISVALLAAARGLVTMSPCMAEDFFPDEFHAPPDAPSNRPLTPREAEVLGLISRGLANKSIARRLGISDHTVKFHISSIYTKLDVANRAEAVSVGARLGIITL